MVEKDIKVGMTFGYLKVVAPKQQSKKESRGCANALVVTQ